MLHRQCIAPGMVRMLRETNNYAENGSGNPDTGEKLKPDKIPHESFFQRAGIGLVQNVRQKRGGRPATDVRFIICNSQGGAIRNRIGSTAMVNGSVVGLNRIKNIQDQIQIRAGLNTLLDDMKRRGAFSIPQDAHVVIKPNICAVKGFETGATVDPFVVRCLVDWILQNYSPESILISESDATDLNLNVALKILGWEKTFADYPDVRLVNMTQDSKVTVHLEKGRYFTQIKMSESYMKADTLISVAKLKTHMMTGITCNLKNLFGSNPTTLKAVYHPRLDDVITDIVGVKIPQLCIVDGIIAMEGAGPVNGVPKPLGLLVVGNDVVATDHACAQIMGFNPKRINHLRLAAKDGFGNMSYEVFGERIEDVKTPFAFIPAWKRVPLGLQQNRLMQRIRRGNLQHKS